MRVRSIPPESQATLAWRNGGGLTRQIVRVGGESDYAWRASIARIDASGPFSEFPDHLRVIALIDGGPLLLNFPDGQTLLAEPRLKPRPFPSRLAPIGELGNGPATVFNLMFDPRQVHAQLLPRPLVGSMVFFDQVDVTWLVYLLSGEAELRLGDIHHWLGPMHGLLLEGEGSAQRAVLSGGGEVVLIRVEPTEVPFSSDATPPSA